jgi:threonine/homoserine/homoserine lactone efflux protein
MTNFTLFLIAAILLAITPGPDTFYVVARSIGQGQIAGIVSVLGISVGLLVHTVAAALGLSALLMTSALAYSLLKYAGAAYLIYLGLRTVMQRKQSLSYKKPPQASLSVVFSQGTLSSLLNPKIALFFLAFLPQFAVPSQGHVATQIFTLGSLFIAIGTCWLTAIALLTSRIGGWLQQRSSLAQWQRWFTGSILIGLGLRLAVPEHR